MHNILLLHGPNLNLLGSRNQEIYGSISLKDLIEITRQAVKKYDFHLIDYQSNHEGYLIDYIQSQRGNIKGIIINAGALTHYSYALHDALIDCALPIVEVHLSDITQREKFRQFSVLKDISIKTISGKKEHGYTEAVNVLINYINNETI